MDKVLWWALAGGYVSAQLLFTFALMAAAKRPTPKFMPRRRIWGSKRSSEVAMLEAA